MATRKKIPLIDSAATLNVTGTVTVTGSGSAVVTFPTSNSTLMTLDLAESVTGAKTFDKDTIKTKGTSTGVTTISNANTSATSYTQTLPARDGTIANVTTTTDAITVGTIELGAATDTTLSRVSAGVIAVEGVTIPTISSTSTLTAKRINPRLVTATSYTTDTGTSLDVSTCDQFEVTAQAGALKLNNPGGTPTGGQKLMVRIKDNGTARALTYDTQFRAMGVALPSTTVISKTLYMGFIYNATDTKWDLIAVAQEA